MDELKLGLIGTGKIGSALMTGYSSTGGWQPKHIFISPRSVEKAKNLKEKFPSIITIAKSNQEVIDKADVIFIGLLPDVAKKILPKLSFPSSKRIISMMATIPYDELLNLVEVPAENVIRTVPLPSNAKREGPILSYPENDFLYNILDAIGTPVMVGKESEIITLTGMTAMISFFYATCGKFHEWCCTNGVASKPARDYISAFFKALSQVGFDSTESFQDMAEEAATPGGLNEQTNRGLEESGAYELLTDQLDDILSRLTGNNPASRNTKRRRLENA